MADACIKVQLSPDSDETVRIPIEDDNSIPSSTIAGFVTGISALKYMDTHSNEFKA